MRKIIILKTGSTLPALRAKKGDFEDWILAKMGGAIHDKIVMDVQNGSPLPPYGETAGIVITGSHAMVTEHQDWSERLAGWLPGAVECGIPILGICYGHQLLAYALGGEVADNPDGREYGTVSVHLDAAAQSDPLLGGFASPMQVHVSHTQSVLRLPNQAKRLAYSERDENQAFVAGECAWGVQFHPEFDAEITREYIHHSQDKLRAEGQDVDKLLATCADTIYGEEIFRRFVAVVNERGHA